jgi:hypothetical protein
MVIYIPQCVTRSLPAPKVYVDNVGQDSQSRPIREFHFSGERFAGRTRQDETSKVSMSVMAYPNTLEGFFSIVKRRMNLSISTATRNLWTNIWLSSISAR